MRQLPHPSRLLASRKPQAAAGDSIPFSYSFFFLAIFHAIVYSLLASEAPAQAFLVREQANFTGLATLSVQSQQQFAALETILSVAILYTTLAYSQRTRETEAQQAIKDISLHSATQPPSLASLAGSVSGTHFLGVFAFLPSVGSGKPAAAAAEAPANAPAVAN